MKMHGLTNPKPQYSFKNFPLCNFVYHFTWTALRMDLGSVLRSRWLPA
jgi:hypothetical protein